MEKVPKVSVLIPTYNYAHFLDEAIQSVLNQSFRDFELIIVDDKSTDNTDEVVAKYLEDKRVIYLKNSKNLGLSANFNRCLEFASGHYIKYLLADDKLHPDLLQKFVAVFEQYPNVALVTSYNEMFGSSSKKRELPFSGLLDGKKVIYESLKAGINWIGEPTVVMFRKSSLSVGSFDTDLTCLVDWEMWLRILTEGDCYIIPETLSYFRSHDAQASKLVVQNYNYTFEDYLFHKKVQTSNIYKQAINGLNIDRIVKKKANYCAKAMYKVLPRLHLKGNTSIFSNAFKIAYSEKVVFRPLLDLVKKSSY